MWIFEAGLTAIEIIVDIFKSKNEKRKKRKLTGKRYNK